MDKQTVVLKVDLLDQTPVELRAVALVAVMADVKEDWMVV
jgi:hypothetical protein